MNAFLPFCGSVCLLAGICLGGNGVGVCAHVTRDEFAERTRAFRMMREAGIDYVRCDFDWRWYQREEGCPIDWQKCDAVVDDASKAGLTVLPILFNPPDWARPVQQHLNEWREFVRKTAMHFKGRIPVYEIWNEENHPYFWKDPDAAAYLPVLRAAYEEVKAVDPTVRVALGGVAGCDFAFLEGLYKSGGKDAFDIMNVHPYCWPNPPDNRLEILMRRLREMMTGFGDGIKPIWITEIGWPTHRMSIPTPGLFKAGLKIARPDRKVWRVGCVGSTDDVTALRSVAAGIAEILGPESKVAACTASGLNDKLEVGELDAVVYPLDESFPLSTVRAVARFVKKGGVLVDFGGYPMYYPKRDGKVVERTQDGRVIRDLVGDQLRIAVYGPCAANGLKYNEKTYATDVAQRSGMKYEPDGIPAFRFFDCGKLREGDELIPLLTTKDRHGNEAIAAGVYMFDSDLKGAIVVSGSGSGKPGSTEDEQAENVRKTLELASRCGIERTFFYEFRSREKDPHYSEDHFGIIHADFSPKPVYEMLKARGKTR